MVIKAKYAGVHEIYIMHSVYDVKMEGYVRTCILE